MIPKFDTGLISVWRKISNKRKREEKNLDEEAIARIVRGKLEEDASIIWQCDTQELTLLRDRFALQESSDSLSYLLTRMDQTIDIQEVAKNSVAGAFDLVRKYGIRDRCQLLGLIKMCVKQDCYATVCNIRRLGIKDLDLLFEIAMICARHDGESTADYIKSFGIENGDKLFEIAKECAAQNVRMVYYIKNFGIEDEDRLFEIGVICMRNNVSEAAFCIGRLNIENKKLLFDLAKICAELNGISAACNIQRFRLKKSQSFEIAKICARQYARVTAKHIRDFAIHDDNMLFEIAKICAWRDGGGLAKHIRKFHISDPVKLFELAKICTQQNGVETLRYIDNFHIEEKDEKDVVTCLALWQNPDGIQYLNDNVMEGLPKLYRKDPFDAVAAKEIIDSYIAKCLPGNNFEELTKRIADMKIDEMRISAEEKRVREEEFKYAQQNLFRHLGSALFFIAELDDDEQIRKIRESRLLEAIQDFRRPDLRWKLTRALIASATLDITSAKDLPSALRIVNLLGAYLIQSGAGKETVARLMKNIKRGRELWKNAGIHQVLVESLLRLATEQSISPGKRNDIIERLLREIEGMSAKQTGKTLFDNLRALDALILMNKVEYLTNFDYTFSSALERGFGELVSLGEIDDFKNRYLNTFGSSRNPAAIVSYAAKIASLDDELSARALERFIKGVLCDSFKADRYDVEDNLHLRTIKETDERLFEKWRSLLSPVAVSDLVAVETEDYMDLLLCGTEIMGSCQGVDENPNLSKGLLGYLIDGKSHMLAIKTQDGDRGQIKARCFLKLLWDGERAVLFRDRFYPHPIKPAYRAALNDLALKKGEDLGIPVLSEDEGGDKYPKAIHALGGPAPFEYSDANKGPMKSGKYTISETTFLRA